MDEEGCEVPQHVQQLQGLAALLQQSKAESDSVTWVPELLPKFVAQAVLAVLTSDDPGCKASQQLNSQQTMEGPVHSIIFSGSGCQPVGPTAPTAPAPTLAIGTQHLRVIGSSSKRPDDWVMTTCLVPDGMPTAAAAEGAGGLAALEVTCRVLLLRDCQPVAASAAFLAALKKVKWQQYGLQYRDYFSCEDSTGVLTLGVLPDALTVPVSLVVCCCNVIESSSDPTIGSETDTRAEAPPEQPVEQPPGKSQLAPGAAAASSSKRRRAVNRRAKQSKPPSLSARREVPLWVGAFDEALTSLKAQLPAGYLQGRHEAVLATCLPAVATSLANIVMRAADPDLRQQCCGLLQCQPVELSDVLLMQLQQLAAEALAEKAAAAAPGGALPGRVQHDQLGSVPAAAAAAVAAAGGLLVTAGLDSGDGSEEADGEGAAVAHTHQEQCVQGHVQQWQHQQQDDNDAPGGSSLQQHMLQPWTPAGPGTAEGSLGVSQQQLLAQQRHLQPPGHSYKDDNSCWENGAPWEEQLQHGDAVDLWAPNQFRQQQGRQQYGYQKLPQLMMSDYPAADAGGIDGADAAVATNAAEGRAGLVSCMHSAPVLLPGHEGVPQLHSGGVMASMAATAVNSKRRVSGSAALSLF